MLILVNNNSGAENLLVKVTENSPHFIKCMDTLDRELVIIKDEWDYIAYNGERLWLK